MAKIPGPSVNVIVIALRVIHKRRPQEWGGQEEADTCGHRGRGGQTKVDVHIWFII